MTQEQLEYEAGYAAQAEKAGGHYYFELTILKLPYASIYTQIREINQSNTN